MIDKAGRVAIPKALREELGLAPGNVLEMERTDERITLHPVRETAPLTKEHGVWVFHSGQTLAAPVTDDALEELGKSRDSDNLGNDE